MVEVLQCIGDRLGFKNMVADATSGSDMALKNKKFSCRFVSVNNVNNLLVGSFIN